MIKEVKLLEIRSYRTVLKVSYFVLNYRFHAFDSPVVTMSSSVFIKLPDVICKVISRRRNVFVLSLYALCGLYVMIEAYETKTNEDHFLIDSGKQHTIPNGFIPST